MGARVMNLGSLTLNLRKMSVITINIGNSVDCGVYILKQNFLQK